MRGEQEQQATQRGDILPHADGTWYLRVTLDVAAGEATGLSCRVKHSSLGGHDIILYWGEKELEPSWGEDSLPAVQGSLTQGLESEELGKWLGRLCPRG